MPDITLMCNDEILNESVNYSRVPVVSDLLLFNDEAYEVTKVVLIEESYSKSSALVTVIRSGIMKLNNSELLN